MSDKKPPLIEIATTGRGRDITQPWIGALQPPQDSILFSRGGDLKIYEEVLRDDQVKSTFTQRRSAVISAEWLIKPGGDSPKDKQAADFLQAQLEKIGWDNVTDKMLYGVFFGHAVAEVLWAAEGGKVVISGIKVRNPRRFRYDPEGKLRLLTMGNMMTGELLPEKKFWTFSTGSFHDDNPYGLGLAHYLYWPVWFKRNGMKFWAVFLEKFGAPTAKGSYPRGASEEEKNRLLQALSAIQTDAGVILPEGMAIDLIEAARRGSADYDTFISRMDAAISKVVLSQTMTTDNGSSLSQAKVHSDVRDDVVKADADLVCSSFNESVARWLTEWNFPGAIPPKVWRRVEEEPDLKMQSETDKNLFAMGYKRTAESVIEIYGDGFEPVEAASTGTARRAPASASSTASFAEASGVIADLRGRNTADQLALIEGADALAGEYETLIGDRVDGLLALLDETKDIKLFSERLSEILKSAPPPALVKALENAGINAKLLGMGNAQR
ncbi:DUF935 family protein [candidate division KSB1 bacterium]|nr:DUF935 family protein [candidate division KSB1 bacterium]